MFLSSSLTISRSRAVSTNVNTIRSVDRLFLIRALSIIHSKGLRVLVLYLSLDLSSRLTANEDGLPNIINCHVSRRRHRNAINFRGDVNQLRRRPSTLRLRTHLSLLRGIRRLLRKRALSTRIRRSLLRLGPTYRNAIVIFGSVCRFRCVLMTLLSCLLDFAALTRSNRLIRRAICVQGV